MAHIFEHLLLFIAMVAIAISIDLPNANSTPIPRVLNIVRTTERMCREGQRRNRLQKCRMILKIESPPMSSNNMNDQQL